MAVLGKRKTPSSATGTTPLKKSKPSPAQRVSRQSTKKTSQKPQPSAAEREEAAALYKSHFEAQFGSLADAGFLPARRDDDEEDEEEEDDGSEVDDDDHDDNAELEVDGSSRRNKPRSKGMGVHAVDQDEDEEVEDGWDGLSDQEDGGETGSDLSGLDELEDGEDDWEDLAPDPRVEVVDHSTTQTPTTTIMSKRDRRLYLSSKTPSLSTRTTTATNADSDSKPGEETPETASMLLKNDLALSRLLSESHILSTMQSQSSLTPSPQSPILIPGTTPAIYKPFSTRHTTNALLNLRFQSLGFKRPLTGFLSDKKMPMNHRKAVLLKRAAEEQKRRTEAKENGIILERGGSGTKGTDVVFGGIGVAVAAGGRMVGGMVSKIQKRHARSNGNGGKGKSGDSVSRRMGVVDMPGMGRMKGAELKLSKREVRNIEGPHGGERRKKKSRGRRK